MDQNIDSLWEYYKNFKDEKSRGKLIEYYTPFLKSVVSKIYSKLPNNIDISDLKNYAALGLVDAIEKYNHKRGIKFETYASIRIRGAIIDEMRKEDWLPRSLRSKANQQKNTALLDQEATSYAMMSLDDPDFQQSMAHNNRNSNIEDPVMVSATPDFVDDIENKICITKSLMKLSQQQRKVIYLYYFKGNTFKEIGQVMDITESRVSQIHKQSLAALKKQLGKFF